RVADWAVETGDYMTEAHMRLIIATALRDTQRLGEALQEYEHLLVLGRHLTEPELMMHVLAGMGAIFEKEPETGVARFQEFARQYQASGDTYLEGLCLSWRAKCLDRTRHIP